VTVGREGKARLGRMGVRAEKGGILVGLEGKDRLRMRLGLRSGRSMRSIGRVVRGAEMGGIATRLLVGRLC
jgi:hypothetical protein